LSGRIVTLAAKSWLSDEREPHTGQAGGIQESVAPTKRLLL
jgi:hypothetical protein